MCALSPRPAFLLLASRSLEPLCTNSNPASIIEFLSCDQPIQAWLLYRQLLHALDSEQQKCNYIITYIATTTILSIIPTISFSQACIVTLYFIESNISCLGLICGIQGTCSWSHCASILTTLTVVQKQL